MSIVQFYFNVIWNIYEYEIQIIERYAVLQYMFSIFIYQPFFIYDIKQYLVWMDLFKDSPLLKKNVSFMKLSIPIKT